MHIICHGSLGDPAIQARLEKLKETGNEWTIYVIPGNGKLRTPEQNKFYRRLLQKFAHQMGRSVEYWHEFLSDKFLGFEEVITPDGDIRRVRVSTAELTVAEFTSFLNACLAFAADNQVH